MIPGQRSITLHTPNKVYTGLLDVGNESLRTIDIFNSASMYWANPAEKSFEDALLLYQARVMLTGDAKLGDFEKLQVKLADIFFFYDSLSSAGDDNEKIRAAMLKAKTKEESSTVKLITHTRGNGFFYIQGLFHGLFKSKSKQRYIPLTQANVIAVIRSGDKWLKQKIVIENSFVGVSTQHIEACVFSQ
jgi:hypothetical protein